MATLVVDENVLKGGLGTRLWKWCLHISSPAECQGDCVREQVSRGHHGLEALKGEYESTSAIYAITPDFCPKPIAWGTFKTDKDSHFYICKFYEFTDGLPSPKMFCANLAKLHSSHTSPTGKFGFHVVTYNGDLPQDNTWSDGWEAFFESGFSHVLNIREVRAGPSAELDELLQPFFENVIPRLLRPLETSGNTIQPSLVHGDLWCGNAAITDEDTDEGIVFDPSSFWGHNEYELGNWRPERNKFTRKYFNAYHSHIPKSAPEDDYDDRNALYAMVIDEMRRLVQKFPDGYTGHSPRADILAHRHANAMATGPARLGGDKTLIDFCLTVSLVAAPIPMGAQAPSQRISMHTQGSIALHHDPAPAPPARNQLPQPVPADAGAQRRGGVPDSDGLRRPVRGRLD
ncbi:hypothetical protein CHU98_g184 [Xylaria longipes]|nr:hypothetical protein CHU98_g184 [Xylaria longipes]